MAVKACSMTLCSLMCAAMLLVGVAEVDHGRSCKAVTAPRNACLLRAYVIGNKHSLNAYLEDPNPRGLNVRSGPGPQLPVIGKIAHLKAAIGITIVGSTGQWLEVKDAETQDSGEVLFKGIGWVYGPILATTTKPLNYGSSEPLKLYREPSRKSAVVGRVPPDVDVKIVGCHGGWARIVFRSATGWLDPDSQCANTLTTCGM